MTAKNPTQAEIDAAYALVEAEEARKRDARDAEAAAARAARAADVGELRKIIASPAYVETRDALILIATKFISDANVTYMASAFTGLEQFAQRQI